MDFTNNTQLKMRKMLLILTYFLITSVSTGQNLIAKTEDGRRVLLHKDKTWEFIDKAIKKDNTKISKSDCNLPVDFKEPKGKNSAFLRRSDATLKDLKKHVSVDFDCKIEDVIVIKASEQKGNGVYILCVKGKRVKYRRLGSVFFRQGTNPLGKY